MQCIILLRVYKKKIYPQWKCYNIAFLQFLYFSIVHKIFMTFRSEKKNTILWTRVISLNLKHKIQSLFRLFLIQCKVVEWITRMLELKLAYVFTTFNWFKTQVRRISPIKPNFSKKQSLFNLEFLTFCHDCYAQRNFKNISYFYECFQFPLLWH